MDKDQPGILVFVQRDGDEFVGILAYHYLQKRDGKRVIPVQLGEGSGRGRTLKSYVDIIG